MGLQGEALRPNGAPRLVVTDFGLMFIGNPMARSTPRRMGALRAKKKCVTECLFILLQKHRPSGHDNATGRPLQGNGAFGGRYFLPTCETCRCFRSLPAPPPALECPDFAVNRQPNINGDCLCANRFLCSTDRTTRNCPSSGGHGASSGRFFLSTCEACRCYRSLPA